MGKGKTNNTGTCCLCGKVSSPYRHPTGLNKWLCRVHIHSVLNDMRSKKDEPKPEVTRVFNDPIVAEVMRLNGADLSFSERLSLVERTLNIVA